MTTIRPIASGFQAGEAVVLASGTYQGTRGVFRNFAEDPNWAVIEETGGRVWSHPVAWLAHVPNPVAA